MGPDFDNGTADPRRPYEELLASESRYRMAIEQSPLAIHVFAPDGTSLLANAAWDELWYLREGEEPEGTNILDEEQIRVAGLLPYVKGAMSGETATPPPLFFDPAKTSREGRPRWLQPFVYPVKDEAGHVREATLIIEDITERKRLEGELSYRANHDALTGLANRALLLERLREALERAERGGGTKVAVLLTDLDNFKYVNDSLGHAAGDELLVGMARRMEGCLGPSAVVARIGGDEFAVLLEGVAGLADASAAAEGIARCLDDPFDLPGGREVFATTSTGIALVGLGEAKEADAEDLLRSADTAMYRAKERGKDRHEAYEAGMRADASERLGLEADLRRALEKGGDDFRVHYQPEISLEDGRIVGFEALVRWEHPERGLVPPGEFVPLAEEVGLIVPLGRWVLEEACRQARAWHERFPGDPADPPLAMSVNLSARQFKQPDLVETVRAAIDGSGLDPESLVLEITESAVMEDAGANARTLRELKGLGVKVAIDDFGTGYSSLAYLKRFPVDFLKIDRSFVDGLGHDPDDEGIVSSVVNLAHTLRLEAIAEGVETEGQRTHLRKMGCETAQGFYFRKPMPGGEASSFLSTNAARSSSSATDHRPGG